MIGRRLRAQAPPCPSDKGGATALLIGHPAQSSRFGAQDATQAARGLEWGTRENRIKTSSIAV